MDAQTSGTRKAGIGLTSGASIWALAFGCIVGWGSFVMPGTTFLPDAGPVGTLCGVAVAAAVIAIIAVNFFSLARRHPENTSIYALTKRILGSDHAFLVAWSLALAYLSLLWANATAFILIGRYLFGDVLQWGFHYQLAGYDVYLGEVLATIAIQVAFGLVVCYVRRLADALRTVLAVGLVALVAALFGGVLASSGGASMVTPAFAAGEPVLSQVLGVAVLAPWLFVGFEAVYQETDGTRANVRKVSVASGVALACGALVYALLAFVGAAAVPEGFAGWPDYVAGLGALSGVEGMPVLFNARAALGQPGVWLVAAAVVCALSTSMLGFYRAAARVIATMAEDGLLPAGLARERGGVPRNAVLLIMAVSVPIPLLGRTAVGWNADVSTLSVAIVYAYISLCALKAGAEGEGRASGAVRGFGVAGIAASVLIFVFLLLPNMVFESALATESYFMLSAWSLVGILYYWYVFRRDREFRFGQSTVMWIMMLFLLLFSSTVWTRLDAEGKLAAMGTADPQAVASVLAQSTIVQMLFIVVALLIMLSLFSTMLKREKELGQMVAQAEARDSAKTSFLSSMSHDIRTPMNAIVGFTNLAMRSADDEQQTLEYLGKIQASSEHLLSLINDVLEMSRIESGKIELDEAPVNLRRLMGDLESIIAGQAEAKHQDLAVELQDVACEDVWCDKLRLNQVLLNLVSNAVKYTPDGGRIRVTLAQEGPEQDGSAPYRISVKDNGIGMTQEFAAHVFEAFEREKTSAIDGIQGTGLGMAIAKRIVDLMGGDIRVDTQVGEGTEFTVTLQLRVQEQVEAASEDEPRADVSFEGRRLLLVDDIDFNREVAVAVLEMSGFVVEEACDGKEAVDKVAASQPGYYDAVLMDVQMPVMDGYEATRAIRQLPDPALARVPIIAQTANAFEEDRRAALDAGMDGHVAKPIDPDVLMDALARVLDPA